MPGINTVKFITSLKQKKFRQRHGLFIVEGEKMVEELIESRLGIHSVFATGQWITDRQNRPGNYEFPLHEIKESELRRISSLTTPNKVLALARIPSCPLDLSFTGDSLTLLLDKVQDPGNIGTLIRTADWFGIDTVILSEDSAEVTSPKVVQSTMGSIFRVRFHYADLPALLRSPELDGIPVLGTFTEGPDIYSADLPGKGLLVLGNESQGISPEVEKFVTRKISIPSRSRKGKTPDSLNIAIAGSIIISEIRRRHMVS